MKFSEGDLVGWSRKGQRYRPHPGCYGVITKASEEASYYSVLWFSAFLNFSKSWERELREAIHSQCSAEDERSEYVMTLICRGQRINKCKLVEWE